MAKVYSGRNGSYAMDRPGAPMFNKNRTYGTGEKTTVRSGVKSSKTYLTTSVHNDRSQTYSTRFAKPTTNKKKTVKKK